MIRQAPPRPRHITGIHEILITICDKWAMLILYELSGGTRRYGELHRAIRGVSQKMLTQTLRKLERDRLVRRTVYPVVPPRVDYRLTPFGETLIVPLDALYRWTEQHLKRIQRARRKSQPSSSGSARPEQAAQPSVTGSHHRLGFQELGQSAYRGPRIGAGFGGGV
jgi:DNA-binding HxlR family transcriptional regulator